MNDLARDLQTACIWEATARKAGNVHRFADFDDLTHLDFLLSAMAAAPVLAQLSDQPLGVMIVQAIRATRAVVRTNTNLGIVLLLAPLAKCCRGVRENADEGHSWDWTAPLSAVLGSSSVTDARYVYEAIRIALPGGLGKVEEQDVADEPTQTLREVMTLAADRDLVARQYANGFADVFEVGVPALLDGCRRFGSVEGAILACQVHWLSRFPDSLIARKRGRAEALEVMRRAQGIDLSAPGGWGRFAEFDRWLRADGHCRNPGTTADLVTACLFTALRERRIDWAMPFSCNEYA